MLLNLSVQNYALIRQLQLDFSGGLSVITGETGAGKSILLGALGLILGQRADSRALFDAKKKCVIEGRFGIAEYGLEDFFTTHDLDYEPETIVRREINAAGKSRAFINDTPVTLTVLKQLGEALVDIHSQHKTRVLGEHDFQMQIVDAYARNHTTLKAYQSLYRKWRAQQKELEAMRQQEQQNRAEEDYLRFLYEEFESAQLKAGEQQACETELELQNHAEEIKSVLYGVGELLDGEQESLIARLESAVDGLDRIGNMHADAADLAKRLQSNVIDLRDIVSTAQQLEADIHYDLSRVEQLNERLDGIYRLQQKHQLNSETELLEKQASLAAKLQQIDSAEDEIRAREKALAQTEKEMLKWARDLTASRRAVIPAIETRIAQVLSELGMGDAQLKVELQNHQQAGPLGADQVQFLFNANRGGQLQQIGKVASGGEMSRLMLSIKSLVSERNLLPTLIFDEIDTGVSGDIAGKVGAIMKQMSQHMQVIAISHLPQIAGYGKSHYKVYKQASGESTATAVKKLNDTERIEEIAGMLSSEKRTPAALQTARELLGLS